MDYKTKKEMFRAEVYRLLHKHGYYPVSFSEKILKMKRQEFYRYVFPNKNDITPSPKFMHRLRKFLPELDLNRWLIMFYGVDSDK